MQSQDHTCALLDAAPVTPSIRTRIVGDPDSTRSMTENEIRYPVSMVCHCGLDPQS